MSKRQSGSQITRDHIGEERSDDEEPKDFGIASSQVMSKRKIAMPKRKMTFTAPQTNAKESSMASVFANNKPQANREDDNEKALKLKALNSQFSGKIIKCIKDDPCCNLTPLFEKYKNYIDSIDKVADVKTSETKPATSSFTFGIQAKIPVSQPKQFAFGSLTSKPVENDDVATKSHSSEEEDVENEEEEQDEQDEEEKKEIKIQGPTFTLSSNPIVKDSTFTFGSDLSKKQAEEKDSDSESEVEIKGPQFKFSGTVKSDVFKLPSKNGSDEKESIPITEEKNEPKQKPSTPFQFGLKSTTNDKSETPKTENPFTFGKSTVSATSTTDSGSKPVPSFSFGAKKDEVKETSPVETPKFSFGTTTKSGPTTTPSFSFGNSEKKDNADDRENNNTAKPSQGFSFSLPSSSNTSETKEESNPVASQDKPANGGFSFKIPDSASKTEESGKKFSFSFGSNPSQESSNEEKKPAFTFGTSTATEEKKETMKPAFSFGQSNSSMPSFSFGKPTTPLSNTSNAETPAGASDSAGFKFSLPFEQKSTPTKDVDDATEEKPTSATNDNATNGDGISNSVSSVNGEEDEEVIFKQKSKLMVFNPETKGYDSKGVGEMKLLQQNNDKSKIRLLCRSDGMGHILLNATIVKSFAYTPLTPEKDNFVKVPTVGPDGKLITYIVQYKQKSDGRQFIKSIEDAKKDM
ncbi:hypothetical protein TPHA_0F00960 [Tetrapisispora phaffii CBS 4417]|uniref:RanBD1 domain-containing protein n=1 Tax=Tetrapisispora phaffii (strain ATCC 24235 / CBS 4417 / NBRC 1672 / NRRL Y-8282 / UCD 70-5) TaxID=1071381 RepID=G8BV00_TETPH|nr:hypothetical protein TPHA_0F00960 [Tetrapisispora phaffii CBS 4417]CCE63582.1 hypothetical protein TPHA_0F00960 [Tetrapisispora phaffii CBS 4417]